ncbi:MAG UNVERIFIED_CONTAM: hypothetical protein LVR18_38230 [Planctomycetaceae bacterium]
MAKVEQAEAWIRQATGIRVLRVRLEQGELARIEVLPEDFDDLMASELRQQLVSQLKSLGFRAVTLDLEGFRSGNLNGLLVPLGLGTVTGTNPVTTPAGAVHV